MDINDPGLFDDYFRELYDVKGVANAEDELIKAMDLQHFAEVARLYRVIERGAVNVLVPYCPDTFNALADKVRESGLTRKWIQKARAHTVGLFVPRADDPVADLMEAVPVRGGRGQSDDWFIYLGEGDYKTGVGLVTPDKLSLLIG